MEFFEDYFFLVVLLGLLLILLILSIILTIANRKTRYYEVNGYAIEVFAGNYNHYIKIDGVLADEVKTLFAFTINLQAHRESLDIQVRIGSGFFGNTVSTKINGVIVRDKFGK